MSVPLYPLIIEPKEAPAIWGNESWKCWDDNRVVNGEHRGKTIAQLRTAMGADLLGNLDPNAQFPILTKIIDARDSLSVQVHPDDAYARRVEHQPNGKTECWYVLAADEGAQLVLGWKKETDRAEYERRVHDGTLGDILRRIDVHAGDAVYLPAGTLHAIGAGIVLFETQQSSDLTYRIFDWNRMGSDGKPRQLHVEKAGDVLDFHTGHTGPVEQLRFRDEGLQKTLLIADARFIVESIDISDEPAGLATDGRPLIVMSLDAPIHVSICDCGFDVNKQQAVLVPAAAERCVVRATRDATRVTLVTPPREMEAVRVRLLAAGIEPSEIDRFLGQFSR